MSQLPASTLPNGREPFLAFVTDDPTLDVLQSVVAEIGWRTDCCRKGGLRAAVQSLSVATSPAMLMIDLSDAADPLGEIEGLAEVCEPGTIVFAVGRTNDVGLFRDLVARGIHDYLVKPLTPALVHDALDRAGKALTATREKAGEGDRRQISVAVVGTRGGVGASMLATSLAWLLSSEHDRSTALLDLDVHFGTAALTLDLEPGRGLADAIEDPLRIDGLFIDRAMVRASEKLAIMSAEAPLGNGLMTDGSAFLRLEQELRHGFEATVIDLPRSIMINFPEMLAEIGCVVVATEFTLASARDAIRILAWLKGAAPGARTIVAANKVHPGGSEISPADFAAAIERGVAFTIPFDHKAAMQAARLGQAFAQADRGGRSAAPLFQLANELVSPGAAVAPGRERSAAAGALFGRFDLARILAKTKSAKPAARPA